MTPEMSNGSRCGRPGIEREAENHIDAKRTGILADGRRTPCRSASAMAISWQWQITRDSRSGSKLATRKKMGGPARPPGDTGPPESASTGMRDALLVQQGSGKPGQVDTNDAAGAASCTCAGGFFHAVPIVSFNRQSGLLSASANAYLLVGNRYLGDRRRLGRALRLWREGLTR